MRGVHPPRALAAIALAALAVGGCSAGPGAAIAADVKTARAERTPEKLIARGRAFANVGDYTRAEQYLSAALESGAPSEVVLPILLKVCIAENRFRAAIAYAEPQLTTHPDDFRLRFLVASLYASVGETDAALEHLKRVAKSKPDYAEVQYAMAVLLRDAEHDLIRADTHFREYLRLEPGGRHAAEARGSLLKTTQTLEVVGPDAGVAPSDGARDVRKPTGDADAAEPAPIWKTVP